MRYGFSVKMLNYPLASMLLGAASSCILITAKLANQLQVTSREYINEFMFKPGWIFLGLCAVLLFVRTLHDLLSKGPALGAYVEWRQLRQCASTKYRLFLDCYMFLAVVTMFFGGYLVANGFLLVATGQVWALATTLRR
mgnify:FL=1